MNVTIYAGQKESQDAVKVSAFEHKGQYTLQIEHELNNQPPMEGEPPHPPHPPHPPKDGEHPHPPHPPMEGEQPHPPHPPQDGEHPHPPHPPQDGNHTHPPHSPKDGEPPHPPRPPTEDEPPHHPPSLDENELQKQETNFIQHNETMTPPEETKEDCLYYEVDLIFPSDVAYYDGVVIESKSSLIKGGEGLDEIEFGFIKAGLDHGGIIFDVIINLFFMHIKTNHIIIHRT